MPRPFFSNKLFTWSLGLDCSTVLLHEGDNLLSDECQASNAGHQEDQQHLSCGTREGQESVTPQKHIIVPKLWGVRRWEPHRLMSVGTLQRSGGSSQEDSNAIHCPFQATREILTSIKFADYRSLALYVHFLVYPILCFALQNHWCTENQILFQLCGLSWQFL